MNNSTKGFKSESVCNARGFEGKFNELKRNLYACVFVYIPSAGINIDTSVNAADKLNGVISYVNITDC